MVILCTDHRLVYRLWQSEGNWLFYCFSFLDQPETFFFCLRLLLTLDFVISINHCHYRIMISWPNTTLLPHARVARSLLSSHALASSQRADLAELHTFQTLVKMQSEMRLSDDGYVTDSPSPTISPTKESPNTKLINKESREFRTKYFTEKVLNNSANGVIYQGE